MPKDLNQAVRYYQLAVDQNNTDAKESLEKLLKENPHLKYQMNASAPRSLSSSNTSLSSTTNTTTTTKNNASISTPLYNSSLLQPISSHEDKDNNNKEKQDTGKQKKCLVM